MSENDGHGYFEPHTNWPKMLPCPFCGHRWPLMMNDETDDVWRYVACGDDDECSARGPSRAATEAAASAWNRLKGLEGGGR